MRERSPQALSEADRRLVAAWAADCIDHVLVLFETDIPKSNRLRALVERTRAYARGELNTAQEIRRRFTGYVASCEIMAQTKKVRNSIISDPHLPIDS